MCVWGGWSKPHVASPGTRLGATAAVLLVSLNIIIILIFNMIINMIIKETATLLTIKNLQYFELHSSWVVVVVRMHFKRPKTRDIQGGNVPAVNSVV